MASQGESSASADPKGKKDYSMAILERKKSPNRLVVDEVTNDDSSVIALHPDTMEWLQLFCGDTVLPQGLRRSSQEASYSFGFSLVNENRQFVLFYYSHGRGFRFVI